MDRNYKPSALMTVEHRPLRYQGRPETFDGVPDISTKPLPVKRRELTCCACGARFEVAGPKPVGAVRCFDCVRQSARDLKAAREASDRRQNTQHKTGPRPKRTEESN